MTKPEKKAKKDKQVPPGQAKLPPGLEKKIEQVTDDTVLPCEFCGNEMSFKEYASHQCDGLAGRNPLREKLKKAKWKVPNELRAKGTSLSDEQIESIKDVWAEDGYGAVRKRRRRDRVKVWAIFVAFLVAAFVAGSYTQGWNG